MPPLPVLQYTTDPAIRAHGALLAAGRSSCNWAHAACIMHGRSRGVTMKDAQVYWGGGQVQLWSECTCGPPDSVSAARVAPDHATHTKIAVRWASVRMTVGASPLARPTDWRPRRVCPCVADAAAVDGVVRDAGPPAGGGRADINTCCEDTAARAQPWARTLRWRCAPPATLHFFPSVCVRCVRLCPAAPGCVRQCRPPVSAHSSLWPHHERPPAPIPGTSWGRERQAFGSRRAPSPARLGAVPTASARTVGAALLVHTPRSAPSPPRVTRHASRVARRTSHAKRQHTEADRPVLVTQPRMCCAGDAVRNATARCGTAAPRSTTGSTQGWLAGWLHARRALGRGCLRLVGTSTRSRAIHPRILARLAAAPARIASHRIASYTVP